jgi:pimeloyl-ACP methyl ester carboxylesterase
MATFVIVHGAWSGGHAWRWVRPLLRSAGHEVFTPALTGLGERSHLASAQVDLETHVRDVIAVLEYEDLREVVLVGHSYGGMVISGVADRVPERLALLVYLDAEVPMDGQSELDLLPVQERAGYEEAARSKGQGWLIRQGRSGAARIRPARTVGSGMAIRRADGRAERTRDGAAGTRQRAGPSRRAWLAASLASADRRRLHARQAGWNSTGWQGGAAPRSLALQAEPTSMP